MQDVTIIMNTYGNLDFTKASTDSIRVFYPHIPIIYADGSRDYETVEWAKDRLYSKIIHLSGATYEDCLNAAAMLVDTTYMLIVNQNVKFEQPGGQIELLKKPFQTFGHDVAQTGAYGLIVTNWEERQGFCGTEFTDSMELDACSGYLTMHMTGVFLGHGGQRPEHFYNDTPNKFDYEFSSDLSLSKEYKLSGLKIMSPEKTIPHLHWVGAADYMAENEYRDWWYKNTHHTRVNPLNAWTEYISEPIS